MSIAVDEVQALQDKKNQFILGFIKSHTVKGGCEFADVSRTTYYRWKGEDPVFHEDYKIACKAVADDLLAECRRRGLQGVREPVFYQGKVCGSVRRFSDTLLIFLAKHNPILAPIYGDHPPDIKVTNFNVNADQIAQVAEEAGRAFRRGLGIADDNIRELNSPDNDLRAPETSKDMYDDEM